MKKLHTLVAGVLVLPALIAGVVMSTTASAQYTLDTGTKAAQGQGTAREISDPTTMVTNGVNVLLWAVGIISVVMLIWGGIRYATSAGDSNKVTAAKNTILYAVIGLVVAIFAYALVNFVIKTAIQQ